MNLSHQKCTACAKGVPRLEGEELLTLSSQLEEGWELINEHHIEKTFSFKNFKEALDFTNRVGALAEEEQHHPDIHLSWAKVRLVVWTHAINGLSLSDFILAAKIDLI